MFSSSSVLNVNGKIFAMLVKGKFVAKLPKARVDELVGGGTLMMVHHLHPRERPFGPSRPGSRSPAATPGSELGASR